jgi:beta-ketoacyl-acyl-carrier-protein synthase II
VRDLNIEDYIEAKDARRMSRVSKYSLIAAQKAVADSRLAVPLENPDRVGVYYGTAIGGLEQADYGIQRMRNVGWNRVSPFVIPAILPNMPAFHVTLHFGAHGPNTTFTTACATGTQTVGEATHAIRHGKADVIITGAAEGMIERYTVAGFSIMRAVPTSFNDEPERASRPFDAKREGFVFSEGAAFLILESLEHAQARNAKIYAEIVGYACSNDAFHMAAPDPSAAGATRTMDWAIKDAGIQPEQIGYINAHGTSTVANDATETKAIKQLFGDYAYKIPISSTKSMIGHAMGGSGAVEAAVCALSIYHGKIHGTINYEFPEPELDLDYVSDGMRELDLEYAMSNSFGLGGQNACIVLRRAE